MQSVDTLASAVAKAADTVRNSRRTVIEEGGAEGWGQFLQNEAHVRQVGPYGTSAAVLMLSRATPNHLFGDSIHRLLSEEVNCGDNPTKTYTQTVRLAFLVLCLAKARDPQLLRVCANAVAELKNRRVAGAGWADWRLPDAVANHSSREETTAWVSLALHRFDATDVDARSASEYLVRMYEGARLGSSIPPIVVAAILEVVGEDRSKIPRSIVVAAKEFVRTSSPTAEMISFFDYRKNAGDQRVYRDYLCFPGVYPQSIIFKYFAKSTKFIMKMPLYKNINAVINLVNICINEKDGLYKATASGYPATVDQAFVALSYDNFNTARTFLFTLPTWLLNTMDWLENSYIVRGVLPIGLVATFSAAVEQPTDVYEFFSNTIGWTPSIVTYLFLENEGAGRWASALSIIILTPLTIKSFDFFRGRIFR